MDWHRRHKAEDSVLFLLSMLHRFNIKSALDDEDSDDFISFEDIQSFTKRHFQI